MPTRDVAATRAGVRALGKQWNGEINAATTTLYAALQRQADRAGLRMESDVAYGAHALQTLDVTWPEAPDDRRPVVVYLHGGGFVRGDKSSAAADGLIYANIAAFFARQGMVGINANYRLAPEAQWPAGANDIRAILAWWREHATAYGGDPNRVYLMGNSAGAAHVATYLFHTPSQIDGGPRIAGALLSSGAFEAEREDSVYYGADSEQSALRAPIALLSRYEGEAVPIFSWSGELDPPFIERAVAAMHAKLREKFGGRPRFAQFECHNHVSHVMSLNSADDEVGRAVRGFVEHVESTREI
jgi:triacylglycerol lipase